MKKTKTSIVIFIILLLLFCASLRVKADGAKKGVAGPGGCPNITDLPMLYNVLQIEWAYTWASCMWLMPPHIEYVPMIRSIHAFDATRAQRIVDYYGAGIYWLVGNEPDNQWQDNLTPMEAADAYGVIVNIILEVDPTAKIIIGNFTNPSQYFREVWFSQFKSAWMTKWNEEATAKIAGWGVHAYAHPYSGETQQNAIHRVQRQLEAWMNENQGMELWVTEYGNLWIEDIETMRQMTEWLDDRVDRYAYFYFGDESGDWEVTSLYTEPWPLPMLTNLGEEYIHLPKRTPTATVTKIPTLMPTITSTLTPSIQPSITPSVIPSITPSVNPSLPVEPTVAPTFILPTPPPNPPMPDTLLGVAQEHLRSTWRIERTIYFLATLLSGFTAWAIKFSMNERNSNN